MQKEELLQTVAEQVVALVGVVSITFDAKHGRMTGSTSSSDFTLQSTQTNVVLRSSTVTPLEIEGGGREGRADEGQSLVAQV